MKTMKVILRETSLLLPAEFQQYSRVLIGRDQGNIVLRPIANTIYVNFGSKLAYSNKLARRPHVWIGSKTMFQELGITPMDIGKEFDLAKLEDGKFSFRLKRESNTMANSMSQFKRIVVDLENAADDPRQLVQIWASLMNELLQSPSWSVANPNGNRIPWREAEAARSHPSMQPAFASPGLYLFGSAAGIPLYLGMTTQTLWKRLSGRYLRGERSQCHLAVTYNDELRSKGIDGFPKEIRDWYRKNFRTSTVRLEGAVVFARHGIDGIWVALLPVSKKELVKPLEANLIPIANQWNIARGYEPHINKQLTGSYSP